MNQKPFILVAVFSVILLLYSFSQSEQKVQYEHMTMVVADDNLAYVFISIDGKEYQRARLYKQIQGEWDLNPLINLFNQYERDGWELMSVPGSLSERNLYWLRREKK